MALDQIEPMGSLGALRVVPLKLRGLLGHKPGRVTSLVLSFCFVSFQTGAGLAAASSSLGALLLLAGSFCTFAAEHSFVPDLMPGTCEGHLAHVQVCCSTCSYTSMRSIVF